MPKAPNIQPNLVQVAWALNLYRLGNDVAGVFIPLVILKSGGKLWMIGLFYLLYAFIKLGINYPLMRIIQNKGAHFGFGAGFTFSIFEISSILGYSHSHSLDTRKTTSYLKISIIISGISVLNGKYLNG
jgi:hypothetical protein